ncbi:uncharacterized protein LOC106664690 [Cimex lectularius]|uniref:Uncharacterized protein n=1 Tax=Cimex lectularius TaxID=79782 RepID=A0A8I6SN34_CIMLE|nr:uncharacterized protein LOC106664690 [Cimex lectularius]
MEITNTPNNEVSVPHIGQTAIINIHMEEWIQNGITRFYRVLSEDPVNSVKPVLGIIDSKGNVVDMSNDNWPIDVAEHTTDNTSDISNNGFSEVDEEQFCTSYNGNKDVIDLCSNGISEADKEQSCTSNNGNKDVMNEIVDLNKEHFLTETRNQDVNNRTNVLNDMNKGDLYVVKNGNAYLSDIGSSEIDNVNKDHAYLSSQDVISTVKWDHSYVAMYGSAGVTSQAISSEECCDVALDGGALSPSALTVSSETMDSGSRASSIITISSRSSSMDFLNKTEEDIDDDVLLHAVDNLLSRCNRMVKQEELSPPHSTYLIDDFQVNEPSEKNHDDEHYAVKDLEDEPPEKNRVEESFIVDDVVEDIQDSPMSDFIVDDVVEDIQDSPCETPHGRRNNSFIVDDVVEDIQDSPCETPHGSRNDSFIVDDVVEDIQDNPCETPHVNTDNRSTVEDILNRTGEYNNEFLNAIDFHINVTMDHMEDHNSIDPDINTGFLSCENCPLGPRCPFGTSAQYEERTHQDSSVSGTNAINNAIIETIVLSDSSDEASTSDCIRNIASISSEPNESIQQSRDSTQKSKRNKRKKKSSGTKRTKIRKS